MLHVMVMKKASEIKIGDMICGTLTDGPYTHDGLLGFPTRAFRVMGAFDSGGQVAVHCDMIGQLFLPSQTAIPVMVEGTV